MITWNYRVFRETNDEYVIREVFYDETDNIVNCTTQPVEPFAASLDELADTLRDFQAALQLPVLTLDDIPHTQPGARKRRGPTYSSSDIRAKLGLPAQEQSSKPAA